MRNTEKPKAPPSNEEVQEFKRLLDENRYDLLRLAYLIFPFGVKGTDLEHKDLYDWQVEELIKISNHLQNPKTRYTVYRLCISSGNGAAKTAFGAIVQMCLLYTQQLRSRMTANTETQLRQVIWPEYDKWFRLARYNEFFFDKQGTSIKAKSEKDADRWRIDLVTWSEQNPASISGLHNEGYAVSYLFEEAPGIPAKIFEYVEGAFTEKNTIKIFMAFGNSDDPESQFEQNMESPLWHARRIDTRTLKHIDPQQIKDWLIAAGGDEDHDDFRVRVRGLPRKSSKDAIIGFESIKQAVERGRSFDMRSVIDLPCYLTVDPAWQGGDETVIVLHQGPHSRLMDRYKLDKKNGQTHRVTYDKLCKLESEHSVDAVFIDQAEGTSLFSYAMDDHRTWWELVPFGANSNDAPTRAESEFGNMRAKMYHNFNDLLLKGWALSAENYEWLEDIQAQLSWTHGTRHKQTGQKMAEPKLDIKGRVGRSPDIADAFILRCYRDVSERRYNDNYKDGHVGGGALIMPDHDDPYEEFNDGGIYS